MAVYTVICVVVAAALPHQIPVLGLFKIFGYLGAVGGICLLYWYGTTIVSVKLQGDRRRRFQLLVSVLTPIVLSAYFFKDVSQLSMEALFGGWMSWWTLVPVAITGFVSWHGADQLDAKHPFRGFLMATIILFVLCFMWHNGVYSEANDYDESSSFFINKEKAKLAAETGEYGGKFLLYITVSYLAMLAKMKRS